MGAVELKVPGGKLIRARAEVRDGRIKFARFTGDFFMTPEEDLEELEESLVGLEADRDRVREMVICFFRAKGTSILGGTPEDFAKALIMALESAVSSSRGERIP